MLILCCCVQTLSLVDDSHFLFYTQKYDLLLVQSLPYLTQHPLRPLNLIHTTRLLRQLSSVTPSNTGTSRSTCSISCPLSISYVVPEEQFKFWAL